MSRRIFVLGNSHTAALILGWKQVAACHGDTQLAFMAVPGSHLGALVAEDGALRAGTPELADLLRRMPDCAVELVPAAQDEIWLCGLQFGPHRMMAIYRACAVESLAPDDARVPVSDAMFAASLRGMLRRTLAVRLQATIRALADRPVRILPEPFPNVAVLAAADPAFEDNRRAARLGDEAGLAALYHAQLDRLADEGIDIVPQLAATRATPLTTQERFSRGSLRLRQGFAVPHPDDDMHHMNADYGAALLAMLLGGSPPTGVEHPPAA